ncbi:MAG: hypothetical protein HY735_26580 [Verrucomicrobia bacterium]|nr:hypothetical protein [Verrucomicrobiota bacterium]
MRGLRDGLSGLRKAVAVHVIGLSNTLPTVRQTYSEWAAAERSVLAAGGAGAASGFLEVAARGLSPNLERPRGSGYLLRRASAHDYPFSGPACEWILGQK